MDNENDSLARLAHAHGMTDLEIEERESVLADLAQQQVRRRMEEEAREREANTDFSILTDEEMSGDW